MAAAGHSHLVDIPVVDIHPVADTLAADTPAADTLAVALVAGSRLAAHMVVVLHQVCLVAVEHSRHTGWADWGLAPG